MSAIRESIELVDALKQGLKNKVCKCIFHDKNNNATKAVKNGNAEERP